MNDEKEILRRQDQPLLEQLRIAGANVSRPKAIRCPFHDDKHPSSGIYQDEAGVWRFKCHVCQINLDVYDVIAKNTNRSPGEILKEMKAPPPVKREPPPKAEKIYRTLEELAANFRTLESVFVYENPNTNAAEMVVVRHLVEGKKTFSQYKPVPGGFTSGAPPKPWPIYNRSKIAQAQSVVVAEGEKASNALQAIGVASTTNPSGAGKASLADWRPLAGKKVYLWPDNDAPDEKTHKRQGFEHMREVSTILEGLSPRCEIYWIDSENLGLPPKGDAVEYIEIYGGDTPESKREAVESLLALSEPVGGAKELSTLIEDTISGKRRAVPWPWFCLSRATNALLPGTVTCLCGEAGSTKSFLALEAATHWHLESVPVAILELEEDRAFHLNRALAQVEGNSELTVAEWVYDNPELARHAFERHSHFISTFAPSMTADEGMTMERLVSWVRDRAAAGARVIIIDPITAIVTEKPWIEDLKFIMVAKSIMTQYQCSLIVITHPKKGNKTSGMDGMAGGAAYQRFAQTVVWLERIDKAKTVKVKNANGIKFLKINRLAKLYKTRNGIGAGMDIGFFFDGSTLRSMEQGVLINKDDDDDGEFEQSPPSNETGKLSSNPKEF